MSLDEENAPAKYISHFSLTQGIVPQRQNTTGTIPFNLMKSETLVWVIQDVDYLETVVRRERQGTSHGLSINPCWSVLPNGRPGSLSSPTMTLPIRPRVGTCPGEWWLK